MSSRFTKGLFKQSDVFRGDGGTGGRAEKALLRFPELY